MNEKIQGYIAPLAKLIPLTAQGKLPDALLLTAGDDESAVNMWWGTGSSVNGATSFDFGDVWEED